MRNRVDYEINLPSHRGKVVEDRLKVLELDKKYEGFTLNEDCEIIQCKCKIKSDGSWNYHKNYDDSENVLMVDGEHRWWTLNESEIKKVQKENLDRIIDSLTQEIERLKKLY